MVRGILVDQLGSDHPVSLVTGRTGQCAGGHAATGHARSFVPDRVAEAQLDLAAAIAREATRLRLGRDVILPLLGGPLASARASLVAAIGLGICLCVSLDRGYLALPGTSLAVGFPPSPVPAGACWPAFALGYALLAGGLYLSLPWRVHPRTILAALRFAESPRLGCVEIDVENAAGRHVSGPSAGLACFCACAVGIYDDFRRLGKDWLIPPWGWTLLREGPRWAMSGGLTREWALIGVGLWDRKLPAVEHYNATHPDDRVTSVVCPAGDLAEVQRVHWTRWTDNFLNRRDPRSGADQATTRWGFKVVACPDVPTFIRLVNPWRWRSLGLRVATLALALLPLLLPRPTSPQFEVQSSQSGCSLIATGFYRCELAPGRRDQLRVALTSSGDGQEAELTAESSSQGTLAWSLGESPQGMVLPARAIRGAATLFFLMPRDPPAGGAIVFIGVKNKAGKRASKGVWYVPAP